ncbi:hypothetical protein BX600DRAFT_535515 [Xylariales sp. PMI_506]|nr:hypothetical protein BX600DRAFT_535515 [Xylariales sp. PMI_506]
MGPKRNENKAERKEKKRASETSQPRSKACADLTNGEMEGYAKIARLMASQDDAAIVRRFSVLNFQNILYLQAELVHLEKELGELAQRDAVRADRVSFTTDWWSLTQGADEEAQEQWQLFEKIRETLTIYNDTMCKQIQLNQISQPRKYDLEFLRSWLERPAMGSFPLHGPDRKAWEIQYEQDLIALRARVTPDAMSRWFTEWVVPTFHHSIGAFFRDPVSGVVGTGIYNYSDSTLAAVIRVLATVTASVLPLGSIIALSVVKSSGIRLGLTIAFSTCFSLALTVMTNAKAIEVFGATAA